MPPAVQVELDQESKYGEDIDHKNTLQHILIQYMLLLSLLQPFFTNIT